MEIFWDYALIAIIAFAITGVLAAAPRTQSVLSLVALAVISAVGGGTIRDLILGVPVFWLQHFQYIWFAIVGALIGFALIELFKRWKNLLLYADAVGVAVLGVAAANKSLGLGTHPGVAVMMGLLTAVGGGVLRDVLVDRPTLLVQRDLYVTPIVVGLIGYVAMLQLGVDRQTSEGLAILFIFGVRAAAIYWNLGVPDWLHVHHSWD
ncbi:MAG: trimeric intracellular cation channel family protein [Anaerolineae bacterium]